PLNDFSSNFFTTTTRAFTRFESQTKEACRAMKEESQLGSSRRRRINTAGPLVDGEVLRVIF
ncbi:hypothetical protein PSY31_22475, partial [Shigella flexneri]|nr:hypothetical protein [Shigella flexneri]